MNYFGYSDYSDYSDYMYRFQLKWTLQIKNRMCAAGTQQRQSTGDLGADFRPNLRTAWKEYITKMNPTDIPRPAPTEFDDSMVIVDREEAPPAD